MTAPILKPLPENIQRPLVSVVMPAYNRAEFLRQSARMILDQTLQELELIICDDHSTDTTPDTAGELASKDERVRYIRPPEKGGITGALNAGIALSRGKYIQICHDHDIYMPTLTEKMAGVMERNPSVVFVHPGRQGCDYLGNPLPQSYFVCGYPEVSDGRMWRRRMLSRLASPVTGLSMIRRSALETVGLFDPEFGACSDIDMWMRLCAIGDVGYVNELLLYVRGREPGHAYAGMNWDITDQVIRTHRKHLPLAYQGWQYVFWKIRRETEIEISLLMNYLNSIRHGWKDAVRNGNRYLSSRGGIFSRFAAILTSPFL
ncbi:MAG: glycosyltransferase family 2 protein [Chloroflexi bacterium]|nr:glycosyltransferase family 2 protein [Chloroflexota bacterium]